MAFQKGNKINQGRHNSPQTEFRKGHIPWIKGKKISENICQVCNIKLDETNWSPCQIRRNRHICKECDNKRSTAYHNAHKAEQRDANIKRSKEYYNLHKAILKQQAKEYYLKHKEAMWKYRRDYQQKYKLTPKAIASNKIRQRRYRQSPKGKIKDAKAKSKRKRNLEFVELNKWFKNSHAHHIDRRYILYIPEDIHTSIWHSLERKDLMAQINNIALDWVIKAELDKDKVEIIKFVVG